jgi:hypothetical protein
LQPESVSIPMTCTAHASQRHETDIIEKITGPANAPYMLECIGTSLDFLQREYFGATQCEALEALRRHAPGAPHAEQVALFFLLLNIDRELKQRLMGLDSNHRKLTRFYLDLRRELVTSFFCSSQPVLHFALKCKQGYLIA